MALYRQHYLELFVNGEMVELESQKSLNLRLNNVLADPTKISNTQADYSFSFDLPSTRKNDRIFNYANNLAKNDKFHYRFKAEVYADGHLIFNGSLTVNSFEDNKYNVNLVNVKNYSLDEIFGEAVLTDIPWYIPFNGATSINGYNGSTSSTVTFPLVCYGAFQKDPEYSDEVANEYTSKFDIDKYNRWWIESFYPSLNMMETLRKAFEWKGYSVGGDAFSDPTLSNIFMSANLSDEQVPLYNLGNPRLGKITLNATYTASGSGYEQELEFPYFNVFNARGMFGGQYDAGTKTVSTYNWKAIRLYDVLSAGTTTMADSYMYDPNEKCIVIPADGFYKIDMEVSATLDTTGNLTFAQSCITDNGSGNDIEEKDVTMAVGLNEVTPIEIQLVRNYEDNCELIKGKDNKEYVNGNPTQATNYNGSSNISTWQTCFPHQDIYNSKFPTEKNDLTVKASSRRGTGNFGGDSSNNSGGGSVGGGSRSGDSSGNTGLGGRRRGAPSTTNRGYTSTNYGYVYRNGDLMAYDQAVSDNFICGFSSFMNGTSAVMKNGYSWSKSTSTENYAFYNNSGYNKLYYNPSTSAITESATTVNENTYQNAPSTQFSVSGNRMYGKISCMVYLNKNDILEIFAIHRAYNNVQGVDINYSTTTTVNLTIEAASPNSYGMLRYNNFGYNTPSEFDYDLKVTNFLNDSTTISSFIQSISDAYNLQINQDGNRIWIDNKKVGTEYSPYAVEIDDRVNSANARSMQINYPKSMSIKYEINEDEWGFEKSVEPQSMLNQPDWKDYADYGYSTIELNDDLYITETSEKSLPFSYTWYDNFTWYSVDSADTQSDTTMTLRMPVISLFTYMIDGYNYDESMKYDGYSLPQRFWFRPQYTNAFVWLDSKPSERISVYLPNNYNGEINLSYKSSENSLLRYFNTRAYLASNYVEVDIYITPDEYNELKGGALVRFDSDLYYVVEISGYDPTGYNETTLKLMKKVI